MGNEFRAFEYLLSMVQQSWGELNKKNLPAAEHVAFDILESSLTALSILTKVSNPERNRALKMVRWWGCEKTSNIDGFFFKFLARSTTFARSTHPTAVSIIYAYFAFAIFFDKKSEANHNGKRNWIILQNCGLLILVFRGDRIQQYSDKRSQFFAWIVVFFDKQNTNSGKFWTANVILITTLNLFKDNHSRSRQHTVNSSNCAHSWKINGIGYESIREYYQVHRVSWFLDLKIN